MVPDLDHLEAHCAVLERIANNYPDGSAERAAVFAAAQALHFARHVDNQIKFRTWVDSWTKPPTALEVLHAKLAGIDDLPHELMDDSMRQIEQVLEQLRHKRA